MSNIMEKNMSNCDACPAPDNVTPLLYPCYAKDEQLDYEKLRQLRKELEDLYNRLNIDTELNMADFLLAEMTYNFLIAVRNATRKQDELRLSSEKDFRKDFLKSQI